ncbi:MAG: hypothetical protein M1838_006268 [Thelocarpon superellum]|nr:MAG: hypothetical protein M1838_006268 [Thelocarpon superellum]
MDNLLPQLLSFPPHPPPAQPLSDGQYDTQVRSLLQTLNRTPANLLVREVQGGDDLLEILDPSVNSLPYLYSLLAHIQAAIDKQGKGNHGSSKLLWNDPIAPYWEKVVDFLQRFDSRQVRYAGTEWRRLVELVASAARSAGKPLLAVHPIRHAILRLDPTSATLTSNHLLFVRLCLEAKTYRAALPVLDRDILDFPSTQHNASASGPDQVSSSFITVSSGLSATLHYTDHLEYHLLGAMVYMGLKKYERALEFLELVISTPTNNTASTIMVEAYKKWVLVSLIHQGHVGPLPRPTNIHAGRVCHILAKPYDSIAGIFRTGTAESLREEFEVGRDIWRIDNNTGLLLLVLQANERFRIRNLENTYTTLSTREICRRQLSSQGQGHNISITPETEATTEDQILGMIARGELDASISHLPLTTNTATPDTQSSTIHFHPESSSNASVQDEARQMAEIEGQIARTIALTTQTRHMDRKIGLSRDYIAHLQRQKRFAAAAAAGGAGSKGADGGGGGSGVGAGLGGGGAGADAMDVDWDDKDEMVSAYAHTWAGGGSGDGENDVDEDMMAGF